MVSAHKGTGLLRLQSFSALSKSPSVAFSIRIYELQPHCKDIFNDETIPVGQYHLAILLYD